MEAWLPNKTFSTHCAHILRRLMDKAMLSKALICLNALEHDWQLYGDGVSLLWQLLPISCLLRFVWKRNFF